MILSYKWTLDKLDTTTYSVSSKTGAAITNLFENADLNKYEGADGQTITYLTRNNWVDTFPKTVSLKITPSMWADGLTQPVPSIGLPGTNDENGPQGFTKSLMGAASAMAYTSEDVMAATYNADISYTVPCDLSLVFW